MKQSTDAAYRCVDLRDDSVVVLLILGRHALCGVVSAHGRCRDVRYVDTLGPGNGSGKGAQPC